MSSSMPRTTGRRPEKSEHKWLTKAFLTVRQEYYEYDDATAEAHLLSRRWRLCPRLGQRRRPQAQLARVIAGRKPEREDARSASTQALERRLFTVNGVGKTPHLD